MAPPGKSGVAEYSGVGGKKLRLVIGLAWDVFLGFQLIKSKRGGLPGDVIGAR